MNIKGYTKLTKEELVELFQIIKELEQMTKNNNKQSNKYKEYVLTFECLFSIVTTK